LLLLVDDFLCDTWTGTATELCDVLKKIDPDAGISNLTIKKRLNSNITFFKENNIVIDFDRSRDSRKITITRQAYEPPTEPTQTQFTLPA